MSFERRSGRVDFTAQFALVFALFRVRRHVRVERGLQCERLVAEFTRERLRLQVRQFVLVHCKGSECVQMVKCQALIKNIFEHRSVTMPTV